MSDPDRPPFSPVDLERARAALRDVEADWLDVPGVHSVGIGRGRFGGRERLHLVVHASTPPTLPHLDAMGCVFGIPTRIVLSPPPTQQGP